MSLLIAPILGAILMPIAAHNDRDIASRERTAIGQIVAHDERNHNQYGYRFQVEGRPYIGWATPLKAEPKIGQSVTIFYDPENAHENAITDFSEKSASFFGIATGILFVCGFGSLCWPLLERYVRNLKKKTTAYRGDDGLEQGTKFKLDYDKMILLDAEDLAEAGIKSAYDSMLPILRKYTPVPAEIQEVVDNYTPSYSVTCRGAKYVIYNPAVPPEEHWGRATYSFFKIVNDQLTNSEYRFYAINGGNDLGGMFLTRSECKSAQRSLQHKRDWPYLPTFEPPWYGEFHD